MLRHYLIAALRNLARNKLYAAINIVGLAVGFAAALLIALYVRHETSYDAWLPGSGSTYMLVSVTTRADGTIEKQRQSPADLSPAMALDFPMIQSIARMTRDYLPIRHGDVQMGDPILFWADSNIFAVLQLPALFGDLATALDRPDGIVISRRIARALFGKDNPIGETLEVDRKMVLTVTAVLADLPSNTNLDAELIARRNLALEQPQCAACLATDADIYLRLKPGVAPGDLVRQLPAFLDRHKHDAVAFAEAQGTRFALDIVPLRQLHIRQDLAAYRKPAANPEILYAMSGIGVLIVALASVNYINLMTARAARRTIEVGVRKAAGATRRDLVAQFVGESIIYAAFGAILALALVELVLPQLEAFMNAEIVFDWWRRPGLIATGAGLVLFVGLLAGFYPAFVLSSFRPALALKENSLPIVGTIALRNGLVIGQFAILIGLTVGTLVIVRQTDYALTDGMRMNIDQIVFLDAYGNGDPREVSPCKRSIRDAIAALPGVKDGACSEGWFGGFQDNQVSVIAGHGEKIASGVFAVDFGFLDLYGLKPVAGRFFSREHPSDIASLDPIPLDDPDQAAFGAPIVINMMAAKAFGFASAADAVGKRVTLDGGRAGKLPSEIIGVAPDAAMDTIHTVIMPQIFYVNPASLNLLHLKLTGHDIPETLAAIDGIWKRVGPGTPLRRASMTDWVQRYYSDVVRQSRLFTALSGVALFIAGLGLFGLSAFTAERRTKEIGIRKTMGARRFDIMTLLLWQFAKPVLLANLIAWPVAYYFMNRWLHGFAAHVELELWIFAAAAAIALAIALATVSAHAFRVASARPVGALRYE